MANANPSATLSSRTLPASLIRARNQLPAFVSPHKSNSRGSPVADTCPDEIWENLIVDPVPKLPYRVCDSYDRGGNLQNRNATLPTVEYVSGSLKAVLYPTVGGKLASLKVNGRELLFDNPVLQPGNLARLNAWTSGGIEWNWPRLGHTVFHFKDVFMGTVETMRGDVLRLWEFDREMNTTYSVDLFAPTSVPGVLFSRVVLRNLNTWPVEGYWWTNIGVNISNGSRVLYPASYAVISADNTGLAATPFPYFSPWTTEGSNGTFGASDHSYPARYYKARENFIRGNGTHDRASMGVVDANGHGLVHMSNADGRKYWVWGNDEPHDYNRMMFLSSPPTGDYLEMQAGVAPTQSQTFPLATTHTFWEVFAPLKLDPSVAHGTNYTAAVAASHADLDARGDSKQIEEVVEFMASIEDTPPSRLLWRGGPWGALHEKVLQVAAENNTDMYNHWTSPFSPGTPFDLTTVKKNGALAWAELVMNGTFSTQTLSESPQSWAVDDKWMSLLRKSAAQHGNTWLHCLHLAVCAHHRGNLVAAGKLYLASWSEKKSAQAARGMAVITTGGTSHEWYNRSFGQAVVEWEAVGKPSILRSMTDDAGTLLRNVVSEWLSWMILAAGGMDGPDWGSVVTLIAELPTSELLHEQAVDVAAVSLLVHSGVGRRNNKTMHEVVTRLEKSHYAVSTPLLQLLPGLWHEAWYTIDGAMTPIEKRDCRVAHPVPLNIDFGGAT